MRCQLKAGHQLSKKLLSAVGDGRQAGEKRRGQSTGTMAGAAREDGNVSPAVQQWARGQERLA
jgi:hypothetical protein